MIYDKNNIFAKILKGEIPNETVYEDEYILAFNNINPASDIHIVVIPKGEYSNPIDFNDNASNEEKIAYLSAINTIIKEKDLVNGCQILTNCGKGGGQVIPHYHTHILSGEKLKF